MGGHMSCKATFTCSQGWPPQTGFTVTCAIRQAKSKYRDKIEAMFKSNNTKQAWNGLRVPDPYNINEYVNELNEFYARFDTYDFSNECTHIIDQLKQSRDSKIVITESEVIHSLGP